MPIHLSTGGRVLRVEKRRSFGNGRHPFHAEVALSDITAVDVQPTDFGAPGSLRTEVDVAESVADQPAEHLRLQAHSGSGPRRGLVVTSEPPAPRTSYFRAFTLLMAPLLALFATVNLGWEEPAAAFVALSLFMAVLVVFLWRPPWMHRTDPSAG